MIRILILALVLLTAGCAVRDQALVADQLAGAVNVAAAELTERYQLEGEQMIQAAESREEAVAMLVVVRQRWAPVWAALRAFAAAHDAWATYLERGSLAPMQLYSGAIDAWCAFAAVAEARGEPLPPLVPCGGAL